MNDFSKKYFENLMETILLSSVQYNDIIEGRDKQKTKEKTTENFHEIDTKQEVLIVNTEN